MFFDFFLFFNLWMCFYYLFSFNIVFFFFLNSIIGFFEMNEWYHVLHFFIAKVNLKYQSIQSFLFLRAIKIERNTKYALLKTREIDRGGVFKLALRNSMRHFRRNDLWQRKWIEMSLWNYLLAAMLWEIIFEKLRDP